MIGNNYNRTIDRDDGVIIRNNATSSNDFDDLVLFAERINEVEQTMDINLNAQKTPFVVLCDEKRDLHLKIYYTKYKNLNMLYLVVKNYQ